VKKKAWVFIFSFILCFSTLTFNHHVAADASDTRIYVYTSRVVYINQGEQNFTFNDDAYFFPIFRNTTWQMIQLLEVNHPYEWSSDDDGNSLISINVSSLASGETVTFSLSLQIVKQAREPPTITIVDSKSRKDIPVELKEEYCQSEGSWLVDDEMLRSIAQDVWISVEETENVLKIVTELADWVGVNIDPVTHEVPYYPNETCLLKEGDCDDQANLLITFCRILGIPAYLQVGAIRKVGRDDSVAWEGHIQSSLHNIGYHGWAMIYIPPWGWLPFDMTLAWKENTVEGITAAPIWTLDAFQILNIVKTDWAGDGKQQREKYITSNIYLQYEDELITQDGDNPWGTFFQIIPYWIFLILTTTTIVFVYRRWKRKKFTY
jgi:transglutaminase-like putative cysteine protease